MSTNVAISRRATLALLATSIITRVAPTFASPLPEVVINKDPNCGCCQKWADHLVHAGFPVKIVTMSNLSAVKRRLGVPDDLASCHTAEMAGYVLEGHVPVTAVLRLLAEKPDAIGLAVPGMPIGSPGMEGGAPEDYEVVLFNAEGRQSYGHFRGDKEV